MELLRCLQEDRPEDGGRLSRYGAFAYLLEHAGGQPCTVTAFGQEICLAAGQLVTSYSELAAVWKWSRDNVRNFFLALEKTGTVSLERRGKATVISLPVRMSDAPVSEDYCRNMTYVPRVKDGTDGRNHLITEYVRMCMPKDEFRIYAIRVTQGVKVFPVWDEEGYMTGRAGDYLAASEDDLHNIFIETEQNLLNYFEEKGL